MLAALPYLEKQNQFFMLVKERETDFRKSKNSQNIFSSCCRFRSSKGIIPDDYENFLGFAGRVATKPGNEALAEADLILFVGSDFPFGRAF